MDMSEPLSCVVPSLDGPVLEVLARSEKPMTGRQVQRVARRGSVAGVAKVLERLVSTGLVHRQEVGPAALYGANRHHLAWPAVATLVGLRATLIERLTDAIGRLDPPPARATLFGSAARGDGDEASDIDILLVHHDLEASRTDTLSDALGDIATDVYSWTGNHVQWVTVSSTRWDQMVDEDDPLVGSVNRDGISLLSGRSA